MKGGGGDTLIFSYTHRLGSFFGFKILNLTIFFIFIFLRGGGGGVSENIFGGSTQNWTIFRGHFYVF